ncbi:G1/S-specific cyclin-E isoform X2 [Teleopsis dalmanni]|uniref:G1/S-specific cyclin-E isoform X2 n=1 Tax=Teleopsis dalmanni TaxID=139649 RepID=UPI0018CE3D4D|nr:G1/S-specific cyclin-E isoform X2 [Teleopsis dalmanni]
MAKLFTQSLEDAEPGFEQPSAKRPQTANAGSNVYHSIFYQSDSSSSVYSSPVDAADRVPSVLDCFSDIPDSPHSIVSPSLTTLSEKAKTTHAVASTFVVSANNGVQSEPHHGERTPAPPVRYNSEDTVSSVVHETAETANKFNAYVTEPYNNCMTPAADSEPMRPCPLPALSWANANDVWQFICRKDEEDALLRSSTMFEQHPGLQPRMRAILLNWLIEVCEVYKLHRETYYLAVDYLDRYMHKQKRVQKTFLQLIGITCLFVAAKVEEIYPPKINEFAYVTDGACQEDDILKQEVMLLQALDWDINPVTPISWLGIYLQLNLNNRTPDSFVVSGTMADNNNSSNSTDPSWMNKQTKSTTVKENTDNCNKCIDSKSTVGDSSVDNAFLYPQFSGWAFAQTAQLLDLCSQDVGMADYSYAVLAAAAMSHTFDKATAVRCSGFTWPTLEACALWMAPFFEIIREESPYFHLIEQNELLATKHGLGHICPNIITDDSYIIQTHTTTIEMFDRVCALQEQYAALVNKQKHLQSPATSLNCPAGLLTPPSSSRKPQEADNGNDDDEDDDDIDDDESVASESLNRTVVSATNLATQSIKIATVTTTIDDVNDGDDETDYIEVKNYDHNIDGNHLTFKAKHKAENESATSKCKKKYT